MKNNFFTWTIVLGGLLFSGTVDVNAQNLQYFINSALENNPGLKAQNAEFEIAKNEIIKARSLEDPQLSISLFKDPMMLPMGNQIGSISGMQMFPWPGALKAREKQAERASEVKLQSIDIGRNDLIYKIKSTWFNLIEVDEQISIKQALLETLNTDKEIATNRISQGLNPFVDVIRADLMIDEVITEIRILEEKKQPLIIKLNRILNRPDTVAISIEDKLPEISEALLGQDNQVVQNPSVSIFDTQIRRAEAEEEMLEYMKKPMIGAGIQYMILSKRSDKLIPPNTGMDMIMPMATITLPIWTKKYDAASKQSVLMQDMYAQMKMDMENEMSGMLQMLLYELWKSKTSFDLMNKQIQKLDHAIELVLSSYANGKADFEELLRLQIQKFKFESEKLMLRKEFQLTQAQIEFIKGSS